MRFLLPPGQVRRAAAGRHPLIARFVRVLDGHGIDWTLAEETPLARVRAMAAGARCVTDRSAPPTPRSLVVRRVLGPFYGIEPQAERWRWAVADAAFPAARIDRNVARGFADRWRARLRGARTIGRDGFVLVPLQGRLAERRSFQRTSPEEMVARVLAAWPGPVVATLHPREAYGLEDRAALARMRHPRLEVREGGTADLLPRCDGVATVTSHAGLEGLFLGKPLALFGRTHFGHLAAGPEGLAGWADAPVDADAYLYWLLQLRHVNTDAAFAERRIAAALRRAGWLPDAAR
ncbi:MAG: capsular polysaccharide export protein, LipB/KpsS family [Hasllibacter sp.]